MENTILRKTLGSTSLAQENTCEVCGENALPAFKKEGYTYVRCPSCGYIWIAPCPDPSAVYQEDYFTGATQGFGYSDYDADKAAMHSTFEKYLRSIERILPNRGELLDIGAATGYFLQIAKNRGWSVRGVEYSDFAANAARKKGLDVRTGSLETSSFPRETFDTITMLDVLEHLPHPRESIRTAAQILKSGGVLVVNTPDTGSLLAKTLGAKWHLYVPPEHLALFNAKNLSELLKKEGFRLIRVKHIGKIFTLRYVLDTLERHLRIPVISTMLRAIAKSPLGGIRVPLNLFDNVFVLAQKK